jgi:MYXO-CTERM domain-containing protein
VLELETALATAPLEISPDATDASLVGSTITYVGYGLTGTLESDPGIARTVDARVSNVDTWVIETSDPNHGPCDGDSGGPLILDGEVIGLSSYIYTTGSASDLCEHGTAAGTRIDLVRDWIASIAVDTPDDTGEPKDTGEPAGPDDSGAKDSGVEDSDPPAAPEETTDPTSVELGCACGSAAHGSGLGVVAMLAFASRRRRSRVCRA